MASPELSLRTRLIQGGLGSAGFGLLERGFSLVIALLLARYLGTDGYGYYSFAGSVVSLLAIPAMMGMPALLSRQVAIYSAKSEWGLMRGIREWSLKFSLITSTAVGVLMGGLLLMLAPLIPALERTTFALALFLLPIGAWMGNQRGCLLGRRLILRAIWPTTVVKPLLMICLILSVAATTTLRSVNTMALNIITSMAAVSILWIILRRTWPSEAEQVESESEQGIWLRSLLPFGLLSAVGLINQKTDILMLGVLSTAESVGIYNIVSQGALLVSFGLVMFNSVLAPNVAHLYASGDTKAMQRLLSRSTAIILLPSILTVGIFFVAGEWFLETLFGPDFVVGYLSLIILSIGQLVNAAFGSVGQFLTMSGHERDTLRALSISAILNVFLNVLLIPRYGIAGAAIATAVGTLVWNILLSIFLYKRLDLIPGPFPAHWVSALLFNSRPDQ